jgi:hypothetical protein
MAHVRLTAAQATVRWLSRAICRDRAGRGSVFRRGLGDLRPRQCRRPGRGAARRPRRAADLARPQRAGHGPCRHRLRQAVAARAGHGLHQLDRSRRDQHGHRRRPGPCEPPAGAVPARRRLCQPQARIRCCSRSRTSATARSAPTTASSRCRAISTASRGPSRSSTPAARPGDHAGSRHLRPGDPGVLPGRPGRGVRLSGKLLRKARLAHPRAAARPARAGDLVALIKAAKRR